MLIKFTVPLQDNVAWNHDLHYVLPVKGIVSQQLYYLGSSDLMSSDFRDDYGDFIENPEAPYIDFSKELPVLVMAWYEQQDGACGSSSFSIKNVEFLNDYPIPEGFDHDY